MTNTSRDPGKLAKETSGQISASGQVLQYMKKPDNSKFKRKKTIKIVTCETEQEISYLTKFHLLMKIYKSEVYKSQNP